MATRAQSEANRQNAQQYTGPRTPEGKAASSRNATRHGMFSRHLVLPGEDQAEFDAFHDAIFARLKPADALERVYAERFVTASWKWQRVQAAEARMTEQHERVGMGCGRGEETDVRFRMAWSSCMEPYQRHASTLERSMDKALSELKKLQAQRGEEDAAEETSICENEPNPAPPTEPPAADPEPAADALPAADELLAAGASRVEIVKTDPIADPRSGDSGEKRENKPNVSCDAEGQVHPAPTHSASGPSHK
jgi:hypothetical protein